MLCAPSEPPLLKALGTYSSQCEAWGCDFLLPTKEGWVGVQRKEVSDLVASVRGDRFGRELSQIADAPLVTAFLVVEGHTSRFGDVFDRLATYSRAEFHGLVLSVQSRGIWVVNTLDLEETADWLTRLPVWLAREEHSSLLRVPKARGVSVIERALMALPGVSLGRARKLVEAYPTPLAFTMTEEEMLKVDNFGPKTVRKIREGLE
jgi:ERCC4-type nuclease